MTNSSDREQSIALVLGAGGTPGAAWIRGCLEELEQHTGFRPEHARVIVGTSVGALAGGSVAAGPPASDEVVESLKSLASVPSRPRPTDYIVSGVRRIVGLGIAALEPKGKQDSLTWVKRVEPATVCVAVSTRCRPPSRQAVDLAQQRPRSADETSNTGTGHGLNKSSTELDSDQEEASAARYRTDALAASCAAPFSTHPVDLGGESHLDGALYSATNADVACVEEHDVLIVIAPLVTTGAGGSILSKIGRRQLNVELRHWAAANKPVLVLHPTGTQYEARHDDEPHRARARQLVREIAGSVT